ncbi:cysteine dioxygenase [Bordetella sp. 15P40C-2]|uniref:cysteine dioxygenase family protein n=1 Tax=Bordetella sp. 15P40C-2 TaxID=2572246 RepID=UPI00132C59E6|nr:cysteine dioxygenase [Bordetella sp. 15P40C-2]MVW72732.1 cysteine dioxygenase [Bordetella sp. 15P40C-2]
MAEQKVLNAVTALCRLTARGDLAEPDILQDAGRIMADLVTTDDWLPDAMAQPHPEYYRQYLLYGDPLDRFSLVSFVWGPGQRTPVHDHTVWGVIAMLRGAEVEQSFSMEDDRLQAIGEEKTLRPGEVAFVSPSIGDIHRVSNYHDDKVSISIHLYGGNIGRINRHVFDPETGRRKPFVSGYSNVLVPNLWAPGV